MKLWFIIFINIYEKISNTYLVVITKKCIEKEKMYKCAHILIQILTIMNNIYICVYCIV